MNLAGFALRNMRRRPGRSIFTILGVALAVASYVTLAGLAQSMADGTTASLKERGIDLLVSRKGIVDLFGGSLPQALSADIAKVPGVAAVSAELVTLQELGDLQAIVGGWQTDGFILQETKLIAGAMPKPGDNEVVVGVSLADEMNLKPGAEVTIGFDTFHIVGVADFGAGLLRGMAVMPIADLQALLGLPGQATFFQVRLVEGADSATVAAAIEQLRPDITAAASDDAARANKAVAMLGAAALGIALVAMAMAALTVLNTLAMAVEERVREIGILASIGWPRRRTLLLFVIEGILLAALGGLIGIAAGQLGAQALTALILPGSGLTVAGTVSLSLQAFLAALTVGALGAIWPAWHAANLEPAAALRHQ